MIHQRRMARRDYPVTAKPTASTPTRTAAPVTGSPPSAPESSLVTSRMIWSGRPLKIWCGIKVLDVVHVQCKSVLLISCAVVQCPDSSSLGTLFYFGLSISRLQIWPVYLCKPAPYCNLRLRLIGSNDFSEGAASAAWCVLFYCVRRTGFGWFDWFDFDWFLGFSRRGAKTPGAVVI